MKIVRPRWLVLLFVASLFASPSAQMLAQSRSDSAIPFLSPQEAASPALGIQDGLFRTGPIEQPELTGGLDGTQGFAGQSQRSDNTGSRLQTSRVPAAPSGALNISGLGSSSAPWTIVVLLTILTLIPSLMICLTPFARLLVVFHFLRQALGLQTTPSNQTLIGLSLVLKFFIMQPVGEQIYRDAFLPLESGRVTALEAVSLGAEPLRHFMARYVREKDAAMFVDLAHVPRPRTVDDIPMRVMMPAYIVSELRAGFQIGAVLFLPFLVVDMVVASITTSIGMMQLPPVVISTPLKLML